MTNKLSVGETIKAGTIVLITSGSYSDYSVTGVFRAKADVVVPGVRMSWQRYEVVDTALLSTMLEEVPYVEAWRDS